MKLLLLILLLGGLNLSYSFATKSANPKDTAVSKCVLQYNQNVLRIPENSLSIGITTYLKSGNVIQTKGFLGGKDKWCKYKVLVKGGNYGNGKIKISKSFNYQKNDSLELSIFKRTHFLGKRNKFVLSTKIPFNYETGIEIIPAGDYKKAPGSRIRFGVIEKFDNGSSRVIWANSKSYDLRPFFNNKEFARKFSGNIYTPVDGVIIIPKGGDISFGDFVVEDDPDAITNHSVKLIALLAKHPAISDTFRLLMDYKDNYVFDRSPGSAFWGNNGKHGHDLDVFVDVYFDTIINARLMYVDIKDLYEEKSYHYMVNTQQGSLKIVSRGQDGGWGETGERGYDGANGTDGAWYTRRVRVNDSTYTTVTEQGPGGNGGSGGPGGPGGPGGDGGDGGFIYISYTHYAEPFLNMIEALSLPGSGGWGGSGGSGGLGGRGGKGNPPGHSGANGPDGPSGPNGVEGVKGQIIYTRIEDK
jgi:hypothetical protein